MIIVSDCVKDNLDEGCIKVASTVSKRLKKSGAKVVAVNCNCNYADQSVSANKAFTNSALYEAIGNAKGNILYIPFASNTLGSAIRTFNLAKKTKKRVSVIFTLRWKMNCMTRAILQLSHCQIVTISKDSYEYFSKELPKLKVFNVTTGVDIGKFHPVAETEKKELKKKYQLPADKTIVLHVGHLKHERNIDVFLNLDDKMYVVLVFSGTTEHDNELEKSLKSKSNIRVIDNYIPCIEELYQASDVYVFPIVEENNSIDVPLSALEAAGCNCKIISTNYKEVAYFEDTKGLLRVKNEEIVGLQPLLERIVGMNEVSTYKIAKKYDWSNALSDLQKIVD